MPQNFFEPRTPVRPYRGPAAPTRSAAQSRPVPSGGEPPRADQPRADRPGGEPPREDPPPGEPSREDPPRPVAARREPSWIRIYWNTLRSFTRRKLGLAPRTPPDPGSGPGPRRTRRRVLAAVALVVAAAVVATVVVLSRTGDDAQRPDTAAPTPGAVSAPAPGAPDGEPSPEVRDQVAQWVLGNVGAGQLVACDAAVCEALNSLGFPASSVVRVRSSAQELLGADVAVVTAPLRARLGAFAVDQVTAPEPIAEFDTGTSAVDVVAVARAGRPAYVAAAAADRSARRSAGTALLKNKRLRFGYAAQALLADGQVDMRMCALLATLSSGHTLLVTSFGDAAPGAGAGVPRSSMDLATVDGEAVNGPGHQATALRALISAQQAPYRPLKTAPQPGPSGSPSVLNVRYAQPAPIGAAS